MKNNLQTNTVFSVFVFFNLLSISFVYLYWQEKKAIEWILPTFAVLSLFHFILYKKYELNLKHVLIAALLTKVSLIFSDVFLSDDVFRYLWDGFVIKNGFNPYLYPPNSDVLKELAEQFQFADLINHPYVTTVYPPISEFIFFISILIAESLLPFKFILMAFDFGSIYLLILLCKKYNFSKRIIFAYSLHPLILYEIYSSAHIDIVYVFFILLSFYFYNEKDKLKTGITNLLAAMVRPVSPLFLILTKNYRSTGFLLFIPVILFTIALSGIESSGMKSYNQLWYFNNPLHDLFREFLMPSYHDLEKWIGFTQFIKYCVMAISLICFLSLYNFKKDDLSYTILWASVFLLAASTTIHPWYVIVLIPFAAIQKNDTILIFTYSIFFSYHVLIDFFSLNEWSLKFWVYSLEYLPVLIALIIIALKRKTLKIESIQN